MNSAGRSRPRWRLLVPGVVLGLYGVLAALWLCGWHRAYFHVLRLFAFEPFRFPFLDSHAVLAAVECRRAGIDVYLTNPCDVLGRPHVYSPLWLRIVPLGIDTSANMAVGIALGMLFVAALVALFRPRRVSDAGLMLLAALSPMSVYALERANSDLVVFVLVVTGCGLLQLPQRWGRAGYALHFLAGLLKYYPLVLLVFCLREQHSRAIAAIAAAGAVLLSLVIGDRAELLRALANIPHTSYFSDSFAAVNLPFGLATVVGTPAPRALALSLIAVIAGLASVWIRRALAVLDRADLEWGGFQADCLIAGSLLLIACFFAAQNVDYRGVYFVLVIPGLVQLRAEAATPEARSWLGLLMAAVVFVAWGEVLRRTLNEAAGAIAAEAVEARLQMLFWLGRELAWWWLIAGLAAVAWSGMRQAPLVGDTVAALRRVKLRRRKPRNEPAPDLSPHSPVSAAGPLPPADRKCRCHGPPLG